MIHIHHSTLSTLLSVYYERELILLFSIFMGLSRFTPLTISQVTILLVQMSKLSSLQFQSLIDAETLFILYLHSTDYFSHHDFTETIALLKDAASQKSPSRQKEGSPKSPKSVDLICQLSNASLWESPLVGDAIRSLTRLLSNEDSRCVAENVVADLLRQFPCFDTSLVLLLPFFG